MIVAMSESINDAGWVTQLKGQGWNHHLSPNMDNGGTHQLLPNVMVHHSYYGIHLLDDSQLMLDRFGFSVGTASDAQSCYIAVVPSPTFCSVTLTTRGVSDV
jgi:hypothetical protein